jgi:hypothetical protein
MARVKFGNGEFVELIGSVDVKTFIGTITFHVLKALTFFLMCLRNMDRLKVYLNNTINEIALLTAAYVLRLFANGDISGFSLASSKAQHFSRMESLNAYTVVLAILPRISYAHY